ncbi:hypothetical protein [Fodinicola feengrottensis]|uniref:Uncharacterized protein n=1 Tax=Fodinicola feengrottensis TaxID=435914 RepID=A0ABN2J8M0_9ACTN|nr:hypothetical protein [Fodinicola feengrottensis]
MRPVRRNGGLDGLPELLLAKHRTPASQRTIPQRTRLDNREVDDSYTVPDS